MCSHEDPKAEIAEEAENPEKAKIDACVDFLRSRAVSVILVEFLIIHACVTRAASGHRKRLRYRG